MIAVDLVPILGTSGVHPHSRTYLKTWGQFCAPIPLTGMSWGCVRKLENLEETYTDMGRTCETSPQTLIVVVLIFQRIVHPLCSVGENVILRKSEEKYQTGAKCQC